MRLLLRLDRFITFTSEFVLFSFQIFFHVLRQLFFHSLVTSLAVFPLVLM